MTLTPNQIDAFVNDGFIVLRDTITRDVAEPIIAKVWEMIGLPRDDRSAWTKPMMHFQEVMKSPDVDRVYTPPIVGAFDDLMGADRYKLHRHLGWWPVTFPGYHAPPWRPPTGGWHVDGSWFHHHVYSREQGLLTIHLYSDIEPGGGGTAIIPGSHRFVARLLAQHEPQGMKNPGADPSFQRYLADNIPRAVEVTGRVGDVAIMHPFMMHSQSPNTGKAVRILCNPCQSLTEHMNFHRENPADYSPVERAIVEAAGELLVNVKAPAMSVPSNVG